ncbi:MAG TPA: succinylglutamate-semialdehyde dehydrogenase, partial [Phycisphaerae bacterium]
MSAARGIFMNGEWHTGNGAMFERHDPAEGNLAWSGMAADHLEVKQTVKAAVKAAPAWGRSSIQERSDSLEKFAAALAKHREELISAICLETGKPRWEAKTEHDALRGKIDLSRQAMNTRRAVVTTSKDGVASVTRYRPMGALAVLGPFNLPAHLPNGQIVPALLAGNTVVFKPSELTPGVGEAYARCWEEAGLPAGVFNMVQGGREVGAALAADKDIAGVLFTGSRAGGVALSKALAGFPEKMLALEMGGNNPLAVFGVKDVDAAVYMVAQSAFITAGQRCTCARRLIVPEGTQGDRLLERLIEMAGKIRVGPPAREPEPFMGPVISEAAAKHLLEVQRDLASRQGRVLLEMRPLGAAMVTPGIMDVTRVKARTDAEHFGPLLQVIRVADFDAAIAEANATQFGLAAGLLSDDPALYERFIAEVRAGIINWNRPTTGASSSLPFGGIGESGNHRPAGMFAIDFCNDPVASLESAELKMPATILPGIVI